MKNELVEMGRLKQRAEKAEALALELWEKLGHDPSCCEDDRPELITELLEKNK